MSKKVKQKKLTLLLPILVIVFYCLTHFFKLTLLPVFADESIYIRWSQLIIDDWQQYAFFPLNDGKTPLHMWLMVPFLTFFKDPLFAGRFLSVLVGIMQVFVLAKIVKKLGGDRKSQLLSMLLVSILPFWYFHHRMALIDAFFTLLLSLSFGFALDVIKTKKVNHSRILLTGLFFGLALWTKIPAFLFTPVFFILILLPKKLKLKERMVLLAKLCVSLLIGLCVFMLLKLHPAFGQLFTRGGDFLYSISDLLAEGVLTVIVRNIRGFTGFLSMYLTWPVLALSVLGMCIGKHQRTNKVLFLSALSFLAPVILIGKVVYPRYLLPVSIFFTIAAILAWQDLFSYIKDKIFRLLLLPVFLLLVFYPSAKFIYYSLTDIAKIPFTEADKEQYLYEWSAGFGVKETVEFIKEEAKDKTVIVATEGYFGTLPDAVLMYLHNQDVTNIFVEGIGQPVGRIPDDFKEKAKGYDQTLLVVNSHRMQMKLDKKYLLKEYCRPADAPCQQVWLLDLKK